MALRPVPGPPGAAQKGTRGRWSGRLGGRSRPARLPPLLAARAGVRCRLESPAPRRGRSAGEDGGRESSQGTADSSTTCPELSHTRFFNPLLTARGHFGNFQSYVRIRDVRCTSACL